MPLTTFVGPTATLIYTPSPAGSPSAVISNQGTTYLYLGQSEVTETSGFPLAPGETLNYLANAPALYAVASSVTAASPATTLTADAAAGATSLTVASGTSFVNGSSITIGSGASAETNIVSAHGSTSITLTTALLYDHESGEAVKADAAPTNEIGGGTIQVYRGANG